MSEISRRRWLQAAVVAAMGGAAGRARADAEVLGLQPFGAMPASEVEFVERALLAFYDFQVERRAALPLPARAFYAPRRRYRAEKLLDALAASTPTRVLGLTASDISTTKPPYADWGILGLATIDGRACVISSYRCQRKAPSAAVATVRLGKTAVHEIGHTLGLEHCPNKGCLMEDGKGSVFTTDGESDLCADCRARLAARGRNVKHSPDPWKITA